MLSREESLLSPPTSVSSSPRSSDDEYDSESSESSESSDRVTEELIRKQIDIISEELKSKNGHYQIDVSNTIKRLPALIQQVHGNKSPTLISEVRIMYLLVNS